MVPASKRRSAAVLALPAAWMKTRRWGQRKFSLYKRFFEEYPKLSYSFSRAKIIFFVNHISHNELNPSESCEWILTGFLLVLEVLYFHFFLG
jgi:hypothetical protein